MPKLHLVHFLRFSNGQCREAMAFYQSVFGGELDMSPYSEFGVEVDDPDQIMWSQLMIDDLFVIMGSDGLDETYTQGSQVSLTVLSDDVEWAREVFAKLSEGGEIQEPYEPQVWGDYYGDFIDRYGMHWMFNISAGDEA